MIDFIVMHREDPIRVEFLGERTYRMNLLPSDRRAIAEVYDLAQVLAAIEQIKKEQKEANLKMEFVKRKMEGE